MKTHNLELHLKLNGIWNHSRTIIWGGPYSLCKGEKIKRDAVKTHFEFYKITKN